MVLVRLEAVLDSTNDTVRRYFTIETTPITDDPATWPHKVLAPLPPPGIAPANIKFYSRNVDLPPGQNTIWVGVASDAFWLFKIFVILEATNSVIFDIYDTHNGVRVNTYTVNVPNFGGGIPMTTTGGGGGTATGGVFDPSDLIQRMLNQMMPSMAHMMGMMMMVQMMMSLMGSMTAAFRGGV